MAGALTLTRPTNHAALVAVVLLRLKKNRPIRADFPPGAGIAKGAAASPLCTFARGKRSYKADIMANGTCTPALQTSLTQAFS
nr:hypothetical protein [Cronobacter turicensis]